MCTDSALMTEKSTLALLRGKKIFPVLPPSNPSTLRQSLLMILRTTVDSIIGNIFESD